jgi:hypothetical protein
MFIITRWFQLKKKASSPRDKKSRIAEDARSTG